MQDYVEQLVAVFREVKRVLADDGTLWLNLGDSYASTWSCGRRNAVGNGACDYGTRRNRIGGAVKEKDLMGIPWRVAFALQADGWYLRSDIIWHKPAPMPESVSDRPTRAHEYLFLLTKGPKYFYNADAIAEPAIYGDKGSHFRDAKKMATHSNVGKRRRSTVARGGFAGKTNQMAGRESFRAIKDTRNKRDVWTVATQPYAGAHFATFPPKLIEPCLLAGTRPGDEVLDPFGGSGTTGAVALGHGRSATLIELNPAYCDLIRERCTITPGLGLDIIS